MWTKWVWEGSAVCMWLSSYGAWIFWILRRKRKSYLTSEGLNYSEGDSWCLEGQVGQQHRNDSVSGQEGSEAVIRGHRWMFKRKTGSRLQKWKLELESKRIFLVSDSGVRSGFWGICVCVLGVFLRHGCRNFKGRPGHLSAVQEAVEGHGAVNYGHLAEGKNNTDSVLPALLQGSWPGWRDKVMAFEQGEMKFSHTQVQHYTNTHWSLGKNCFPAINIK